MPRIAKTFYVIIRSSNIGIFSPGKLQAMSTLHVVDTLKRGQTFTHVDDVDNVQYELFTNFKQAFDVYDEMYHDGEVEVAVKSHVVSRSPGGPHAFLDDLIKPSMISNMGGFDRFYIITRGSEVGIFFSW